jgi:hypothetical protein
LVGLFVHWVVLREDEREEVRKRERERGRAVLEGTGIGTRRFSALGAKAKAICMVSEENTG